MVTKIKYLKEMKFDNAHALIGLPGIGLVGKIVVDYLLKELKATKFAKITSDAFPPSVHTKRGLLELVQDELYYYSHKGKDFVFLAGPVQPSLDVRACGSKDHYEFSSAIVSAFNNLGVTNVCTLAGINVGDKRLSNEPRVVVAGTNKKIVDEWKKHGAVTEKYDGLISGVSGLVLGIGVSHNLAGACLMGETNPNIVYGDHGAAKRVLEIINKKYNFKVKMNAIEKEAKQIEKAFQQLQSNMEKEEDEEDELPKTNLSYVR